MANEFTKLTEKEVVESVSENGHLFAEDNGKIVRVPAANVSGRSAVHAYISKENSVYTCEIADGSEVFDPEGTDAQVLYINNDDSETCRMISVCVPGDGFWYMTFYSYLNGSMITLKFNGSEIEEVDPVE